MALIWWRGRGKISILRQRIGVQVGLILYHWSTSNRDEASDVNVCLHVCSHQRLLFTLLGHSDDLDKDTMSDVSKDVLRILSEELASRSILYKQVQTQ